MPATSPNVWSCFFFQAEAGIRDVAVTGVQTCALPIYFADNVRFPADVDDHEIVACDRAKAHGVGRIGFLGPVIILAREMQKPGLRKPRAKIRKVHVAELFTGRSEEHTSELQSRLHLVCRLLLEKKKK